jgi:hypothetical protein
MFGGAFRCYQNKRRLKIGGASIDNIKTRGASKLVGGASIRYQNKRLTQNWRRIIRYQKIRCLKIGRRI